MFVHHVDDDQSVEVSDDAAQVADMVIAAYGPLAKAFVVSRVQHAIHELHSKAALDFWGQVGEAVWAIDPDASAGCPATLADTIRLN